MTFRFKIKPPEVLPNDLIKQNKVHCYLSPLQHLKRTHLLFQSYGRAFQKLPLQSILTWMDRLANYLLFSLSFSLSPVFRAQWG